MSNYEKKPAEDRLPPYYVEILQKNPPIPHAELLPMFAAIHEQKKTIWGALLTARAYAKEVRKTTLEALHPEKQRYFGGGRNEGERRFCARYELAYQRLSSHRRLLRRRVPAGQREFVDACDALADTLAWLDSDCSVPLSIAKKWRTGSPGQQEIAMRITVAHREYKRQMQPVVQANLRLVVKVARNLCRYDMSLYERVAYGNMGLMKAVARFDPTLGFRLSTYATGWIKHEVTRSVNRYSANVRKPVYLWEWRRKIYGVRSRHPGIKDSEIVEMLNKCTLDIVRRVDEVFQSGVDMYLQGNPDGSKRDSTEETRSVVMREDAPHQIYDDFDEQARVREIIYQGELLDERERRILMGRFGFDCEPMSLTELGEEYDVSREWIRQLETKALAKVRRALSPE